MTSAARSQPLDRVTDDGDQSKCGDRSDQPHASRTVGSSPGARVCPPREGRQTRDRIRKLGGVLVYHGTDYHDTKQARTMNDNAIPEYLSQIPAEATAGERR